MTIEVVAADEAVVIEEISLIATGYPLDRECMFSCGDPDLDRFVPLLRNVLRACSHDTFMDCPYYERIMYAGDTRLEALAVYVGCRDAALPRKAIAVFDWSRDASGFTASRYPCRHRQTIPPFSLWWIGMVRDYAFWRDDPAWVRSRLPGVRNVLDTFFDHIDPDTLTVGSPRGWNFHDWVPSWRGGMPPKPECERTLLTWHLILAMGYAIEIEEALGDSLRARRLRALREPVAVALDARAWAPARGLYADDSSHETFSVHGQALAILSGMIDPARHGPIIDGILRGDAGVEPTIYYSHYLFEALTVARRIDILCARLDLWRRLPDQGFVTTPEQPEPSRSDCHAWGAHPLYHFLASILGIRPASPGFRSAVIAPCLGPLAWASGEMPHPAGTITVHARRENGRLRCTASVPDRTKATLVIDDTRIPFTGSITV